MITEIGPSKSQKLKIYAPPIFLIVGAVFIYQMIYVEPNNKAIIPIVLACVVSVTLVILILFTILEIIYVPSGVIIDNELNQLTLKYLKAKPKTIYISDISEYEDVVIPTRGGSRHGLVIHLQNGKQALLSDLNLDGYAPVKQFLDSLNISNMGEKRFWYAPYFMHQ